MRLGQKKKYRLILLKMLKFIHKHFKAAKIKIKMLEMSIGRRNTKTFSELKDNSKD